MELIVCLAWFLSGLAAFGLTYNNFQTGYPVIARESESSDTVFAVLIGLSGPIGLLVSLFPPGKESHVKRKLLYPWQRELRMQRISESYRVVSSNNTFLPSTYEDYLRMEAGE